MKRVLFLLLCLALLFATGCQSISVQESLGETQTISETNAPQSSEGGSTSPSYSVPDPLTWADIDAIPIANASMSIDELRRICTDFFRLQISFQWISEKTFSYVIRTGDRTVTFQEGVLYGGLPYTAPNNGGNLYIWMNYYDSETGVLQLGRGSSNDLMYIVGNHCSHGSFWAWSRVINSITTCGTRTFNYQNGCIPVGPYEYDLSVRDWQDFPDEKGCRSVCRQNGKQIMYQSYAELLEADGLVNDGHVIMAATAPKVVYLDDNKTIDGKNSTLTILEQTSSMKDFVWPDGTTGTVQSGVDLVKTFEELYNSGYIPFTFKEFLGQDPVEKASLSVDFHSPEATLEDLKSIVIRSNYTISDVTVEFTDDAGNVLHTYKKKYIPDPDPEGRFNTVLCKNLSLENYILPSVQTYIKNKNASVSISCRVSTGEVLSVYEGKVLQS